MKSEIFKKSRIVHKHYGFERFYNGLCDRSSDTTENQREDSKEEQIKKSFEKTLDMYPLRT